MTSTQHTGVVVSAKEADAWHKAIKEIMAGCGVNFADAVNLYIEQQQTIAVRKQARERVARAGIFPVAK